MRQVQVLQLVKAGRVCQGLEALRPHSKQHKSMQHNEQDTTSTILGSPSLQRAGAVAAVPAQLLALALQRPCRLQSWQGGTQGCGYANPTGMARMPCHLEASLLLTRLRGPRNTMQPG